MGRRKDATLDQQLGHGAVEYLAQSSNCCCAYNTTSRWPWSRTKKRAHLNRTESRRSRETNQLYQDELVPSAAKTMPNRPRVMQDGASGARRSPGFLRAADNYKEVRFIQTLTTAEKERALEESNVSIPSLSLFTAVRQFKPKSTPLAQPSFYSRFS